jgi:DNA adenine methylase
LRRQTVPLCEQRRTSPFLRWAGGKQWLSALFSSVRLHPEATYYEPFLGGGAAFFTIKPKRAVLGDLNTGLVEAYMAVRDNPHAVMAHLQEWKHDAKTYYAVRAASYRGRYAKAAAFIFLNKACWNGLYRVSRKGKFNVPFGYNESRSIFERESLLAASRSLRGTTILAGDFEQLLASCSPGDVAYLDPPYTLRHASNGFRRYNESLFSWSDQGRLATITSKVVAAGCEVMITNALHNDILELYPNLLAFRLSRKSLLSGKPSCRGTTEELLLLTRTLAATMCLEDREDICRIR